MTKQIAQLSPKAAGALAVAGGIAVVTVCLFGAHWLLSLLVDLLGVH
jgi:hypothetical protein